MKRRLNNVQLYLGSHGIRCHAHPGNDPMGDERDANKGTSLLHA